MSDVRKPPVPLVSLVKSSQKSERELLLDIAAAVDGVASTADLTLLQTQRNGQQIALVQQELDELKGHVMRADATARQVSNHDLEQDARIAALETGWQRLGRVLLAILDDKRTKAVGKTIFALAMGYAAAKGFKVLP